MSSPSLNIAVYNSIILDAADQSASSSNSTNSKSDAGVTAGIVIGSIFGAPIALFILWALACGVGFLLGGIKRGIYVPTRDRWRKMREKKENEEFQKAEDTKPRADDMV